MISSIVDWYFEPKLCRFCIFRGGCSMSLIKDKKLPVAKLRRTADIGSLGFRTTKSLPKLEALVGQERAVHAVSFGLSVQSKGYNIFMVGEPGSGRTTYAMQELTRCASTMPAPDDWVYVYNFDEPGTPLAVRLPAGKGKELSKDAENAVEDLKSVLAKAFDNNEFEDNKAQLVKSFQEEVNKYMEELRKWAEEKRFAIKRTPQGFVNLPMIFAPPVIDADEKSVKAENEAEQAEKAEAKNTEPVLREMQQEEFENLSEEEQEKLQKASEEISQKTLETLRSIREREKDLKEKIKELEGQICRNAIGPILSELRAKYAPNKKLEEWFDDFTEDIVANFNAFLAAARDEAADVDFSRYEVNSFVSNNPNEGAPVIRETNPVYYNLVGKVEYESRQGNLYTDFNVGSRGLIFNNATGYTSTRLGGYIDRNFRLGTVAARTILNEVTGTRPTRLNGYMEIAGQKADLVIANPNGIAINGGGYINTASAVLAAAPVQNRAGHVDFAAPSADILIQGEGLDADTTNKLIIQTKNFTNDASELWSNSLELTAGGILYNSGKLAADQDMQLHADNLTNEKSAVITGGGTL